MQRSTSRASAAGPLESHPRSSCRSGALNQLRPDFEEHDKSRARSSGSQISERVKGRAGQGRAGQGGPGGIPLKSRYRGEDRWGGEGRGRVVKLQAAWETILQTRTYDDKDQQLSNLSLINNS